MYALDYLRRWQASTPSARDTIDWVRSKRMDRLQPDERVWFESTFPPMTQPQPGSSSLSESFFQPRCFRSHPTEARW